jgi:hypothetical protein
VGGNVPNWERCLSVCLSVCGVNAVSDSFFKAEKHVVFNEKIIVPFIQQNMGMPARIIGLMGTMFFCFVVRSLPWQPNANKRRSLGRYSSLED